MEFRAAEISDLQTITEIYNYAVEKTAATFETRPQLVSEQLVWFKTFGANYPLIVVAVEELVVGWSSLKPWSDRPAYSKTVEISTYLSPDFHGRGIGRKLKSRIIDVGREMGFYSIISRIVGENEANIKLNRSLGFRFIGTMNEVGFKFGKFHDVHLFQYNLRFKL